MTTIAFNMQAVGQALEAAAAAAQRAPDSVQLLAVSKTFPAAAVRAAYAAGQRQFGESYVQEALTKQTELADLADITWHFIGPLQSNKTRAVAEHFSWVHSVDRLKIARRLSEQRPETLPPLQVCIEVNTSGETSKGGIPPADAADLAQQIRALPRLQLRGLMSIPAATDNPAAQRRAFAILRELRDTLNGRGLTLDTLSMGMSGDFPAAIAEGATLVRIGSALFGQRTYGAHT